MRRYSGTEIPGLAVIRTAILFEEIVVNGHILFAWTQTLFLVLFAVIVMTVAVKKFRKKIL